MKQDNTIEKRFYLFASAAARVLVVLLIISVPVSLNPAWKRLEIFSDNWLLLIFKLNFGIAQKADLSSLHVIDFALLALFCFIFAAIFYSIRKKGIVWNIFSIWALISPPLGIVMLIVTHTAGRTGVLTGGLIFSILTLLGDRFSKTASITGISAFFILLAACDGVSGFFLSKVTGIFIMIGYVLLACWLFLIAGELRRDLKGE